MHIKFLRNYRIRFTGVIFFGIFILFALTACMGNQGAPQGWAGGVVVDDNFVTASMDGQLVSLNIDTGKQNWEPHMIRVTDDDDDKRAIYATPAVYDGVAFIASYDGKIHAISLSDGELIDSVTLDSAFIGGIFISEDKLFLVSEVGILYGYRIVSSVETKNVTLEPLWNPILIADGVWSTPVVHGEYIYVTSLDHSIYAIDAISGKKIWSFATQGAIVSSPILYQDNLMFGSFDGNFYSLNPDTGKENWIFRGSNHWYWADPIVGYDGNVPLVFATSLGGYIYAIQIQTGIQQWESNIESAIVGAPAIVKDMLVFGSRDETVYVSEISSGITLGTCDIGDRVETPMTAINDIVFFGARDHSIRALKIKQNGNPDENWDSPYFSDKAKERKSPYVLDWVPGC
jgi:outer membrane protein assembly factor BamB